MGANQSGLDKERLTAYKEDTGLSKGEIKRLFKRFIVLDKNGDHMVSRDEFLCIPEFFENPLKDRITDMFFGESETLSFDRFLRTLAVFSHRAPLANKQAFAFDLFDVDRSGKVSRNNMLVILFLIVGNTMDMSEIQMLVDRTFLGLGVGQDEDLCLETFKTALDGLDIGSLFTVSF